MCFFCGGSPSSIVLHKEREELGRVIQNAVKSDSELWESQTSVAPEIASTLWRFSERRCKLQWHLKSTPHDALEYHISALIINPSPSNLSASINPRARDLMLTKLCLEFPQCPMGEILYLPDKKIPYIALAEVALAFPPLANLRSAAPLAALSISILSSMFRNANLCRL